MGSRCLAVLLLVLLPAASLSAGGALARSCSEDWPTFRGDNQRTGTCGNVPGPGTGEVLWRLTTKGMNIPGSPAVVNETVYFAAGPYVYAVDGLTGEVRWTYEREGGGSSPAVVDGVVYIGSGDGYTYALDAQDGLLVWRYEEDQPLSSPPTVADGVVYIGSWSNAVLALDARTGERLWRTPTVGRVTASPLVADNTVQVVTRGSDGVLYALDAETGETVWTREMGDDLMASPSMAEDLLFVYTLRGRLEALNPATGEVAWVRELPRSAGANTPVVVPPLVFAPVLPGGVYAADVASGEERWIHREENGTAGSLAAHDGYLYLVDSGGKVMALQAGNGDPVWESQVTVISRSSPTLANGILYVGSDNFEFVALDTGHGVGALPPTGEEAPTGSLGGALVALLLSAAAASTARSARVDR